VVLNPHPHLQFRGLQLVRAIPLPALRTLVACYRDSLYPYLYRRRGTRRLCNTMSIDWKTHSDRRVSVCLYLATITHQKINKRFRNFKSSFRIIMVYAATNIIKIRRKENIAFFLQILTKSCRFTKLLNCIIFD
jgi:hypothetical protein